MTYTEYQLIQFAQNSPQELIKIINNNYNDIKTLSLTIDILSTEVTDEQIVPPILNKFLKHVHVSVRESALSGVVSFYTNKNIPQDILTQIKNMADHDPSSLLKEYANDLLQKVK